MRLLLLLFTVLTLSTPAPAQTPPAPTPSRQGAWQHIPERGTAEKALRLLDEAAAEARGLRLADNRALVLAAAADLYWEHDPERARNLYKEAAEAAGAGMSAIDPGTQPELLEVFELLQEELITAAGRRDANFALELLRLSEQFSARQGLGRQRQRLEEVLAAESVAQEPRRAEALADQSLARGKFEQLPRLIVSLRANDQEAAARVARKFLAKLRAQNGLAADARSVDAMFGLLNVIATPPGGAGALLEQRSVRELTEMAVAAASSSNDPGLLLTLKPALSSVQKVMPEAVPSLLLKLDELAGTYGEAAEDDYLPDGGRPRGATGPAGQSGPNAARVEELTGLASGMLAEGNLESARKALDEARELVGERVRNGGQLAAILNIAAAYADLDPGQSFRLIESVAGQLDFLAVATKTVGGFLTEHFERDDELLLRPLIESASKIAGDDLGRFSALASHDFGRLKAVADRFQHPETRVLVRLLLARTVLELKATSPRK